MFADFIKHYDLIRSILRDVFLYGCFSRDDYESKKRGSSRKVSYEMRRIQQYIEKDFIKFDRDGKTKLLSLSYDSITNTKNFLVSTYLNKSFTKSDLKLYYYILLTLNQCDRVINLKELEVFLIDNELLDFDKISSKTIERKLSELCDSMGLVDIEKQGRCKAYRLTDDILREITDEELIRLYLLTSLYKNILFPNIGGYYFEDTLRQYMNFHRNITEDYDDIFQYQNLHFHPIIEEEILWKLIKAINENRKIKLDYKINESRRARYNQETVIPYKIRYDINCGRFYLVAFQNERCFISRLDRIHKVKILNDYYHEDGLSEKYNFSMGNSWSSVHLNGESTPQILKFKITINNKSEMYIVERIKGELKTYTVEQDGEDKFLFTKVVNDCYEMIPWIRGYGGKIEIIEPSYIRRKIDNDWKEMLKNYGVIS
ncbi:helix-turn-helix transcriptional regulator [Clostridium intestinale]|uniref:Predicted DNA-binding transcriptional regulator YafY, contains an HTH and WYL domains n=1 Tax=Clostridium intestinale DSM 6191 TaxID=1121320 RepID=A0A1M5ULR3_9CLOT|nr:WYL domain-containing protein [Clostridium intestinale]SHH63870.1 Predicted DNA-binding transcriptional regulator YafY, contains an HTH and WYL domains [Clostridium intestinale DSM 6191]